MTAMDLLEQIEKATGPNRVLDRAIARSLETLPTKPFETAAPFERLGGMYWVFGKKDTPDGEVEEKWSKCPPLYTSSVDAALTYIPKGFIWKVFNDFPGDYYWCELTSDDWLPGGKLHTVRSEASFSAALAICEAAAKSRGHGQSGK